MSAVAGYSNNQRRVLDALGLSLHRQRSRALPTAEAIPAGQGGLLLRGAGQASAAAFLQAVLDWLPVDCVERDGDVVHLRLPAGDDAGLGPVIDIDELRRHPQWKRRLWSIQRRLRRQGRG